MAARGSKAGVDRLFERLSIQAPEHYRRWVRAGVVATSASYALAFAIILLEQPWSEQAHPRELYVVLAGCVAAWLERRGKVRAAARLVLGAIWLEMHVTLLTLGARAAVGGVFPAILVGVVLFFGARAGMLVALSALLSVPLAVLAGPWLRVGPGLGAGDLLYVVSIEACTLGVTLLLSQLMRTFDGVLASAEGDARRLRELIDGAPDAIVVVNEAGTIEDCNPSAELLFLRRRAELVGARFMDLGLRYATGARRAEPVDSRTLDAEPAELWGPPVDGAAATGEGSPHGGRTPLEGVARAVSRHDGARDSVVMLRDISLRLAAEAQSAQLQRQLQQSQKLEALGKLAGGVAHDFNNLLMAVGGFAEALSRHPDARVRDVAASLLGLRQQAAGLTEHLVAFARKGMTQPRALELSQTVRDSPRLLEPLLGPQVNLQLDAPGSAFIQADPAQIEQVLLNLALNARDAMPSGGTLRIGCRLLEETGRVELTVADTGHGMDEATRRSAFEPFFTTKPRRQGTGLGLALVQGIVEASGGSIRLESAPGRGAEFTLTWPALRASSDGLAERPERGAPHAEAP